MTLDNNMRLLVIEPGMKLWGSEKAFLSTLPELIKASDSLVVTAPLGSELIGELPSAGVVFEPSPIGGLHKTKIIPRILAILYLIKLCLKHKVDKIYLNQAGLCRIVHLLARLLRLPIVVHVRLIEDIPRCSKLMATKHAPIDLIFVSHDMYSRYQKLKNNDASKKLFVAYDPYELAEPYENNLGGTSDLACLGRLEEGKGQLELIEALVLHNEQHRELKLSIYGSNGADESYETRVKDHLHAFELEGVVTLHGFVPNAASKINSYKYLISGSRYESFGRTIVEAWDAGCLPICSKHGGGAAEIIASSGGGILYSSHDPQSIANSIAKADSLPESQRRIYIENGRFWVRNNLSIEAYRKTLTGVLFPIPE